jgi:hypothetical protein
VPGPPCTNTTPGAPGLTSDSVHNTAPSASSTIVVTTPGTLPDATARWKVCWACVRDDLHTDGSSATPAVSSGRGMARAVQVGVRMGTSIVVPEWKPATDEGVLRGSTASLRYKTVQEAAKWHWFQVFDVRGQDHDGVVFFGPVALNEGDPHWSVTAMFSEGELTEGFSIPAIGWDDEVEPLVDHAIEYARARFAK